jgi:formylglycine-generating enzyme required for sulfatase activity
MAEPNGQSTGAQGSVLEKRVSFLFEGTLSDALSEFWQTSGIMVDGIYYLSKSSPVDYYVPPAKRSVKIDMKNVPAKRILDELAEQGKIGYEVKDSRIWVHPFAITDEIPEDVVSEKVKELLPIYLHSRDGSEGREIFNIRAPLVVARALIPYLKSHDPEMQKSAILFCHYYFRGLWDVYSDYWLERRTYEISLEEKRETQACLLEVLEDIVSRDLWKHDRWLIRALGRACRQKAIPVLKQVLKEKGYEFYAAVELALLGDRSGEEVLVRNLTHEDREQRFEAAETLFIDLQNHAGLDVLIKDMKDVAENMDRNDMGGSGTLQQYIRRLGEMRDTKAVPAVMEMVLDKDPMISYMACWALTLIAGWEYEIEEKREFDTYFTPKEEVYRNWKKWWDERQEEGEKSPDERKGKQTGKDTVGDEAKTDRPGPFDKSRKKVTNSIGMEFVYIPPTGEKGFMMGSPESEDERDPDEKQHKVILTEGFYLQTTEVTEGQWKEIMGTEPWESGLSSVGRGPDYPAVCVSWNDSRKFMKKLNEKEGTDKYRLPTEAEWEYACRAGTKTRYSWGDEMNEDYCWYLTLKGYDRQQPVGTRKPNAWGLYDMSGNVWEWCQDRYDKEYYEHSPEKDPRGPRTKGKSRVLRGGSWISPLGDCRSADRNDRDPLGPVDDISGFRVARTPD